MHSVQLKHCSSESLGSWSVHKNLHSAKIKVGSWEHSTVGRRKNSFTHFTCDTKNGESICTTLIGIDSGPKIINLFRYQYCKTSPLSTSEVFLHLAGLIVETDINSGCSMITAIIYQGLQGTAVWDLCAPPPAKPQLKPPFTCIKKHPVFFCVDHMIPHAWQIDVKELLCCFVKEWLVLQFMLSGFKKVKLNFTLEPLDNILWSSSRRLQTDILPSYTFCLHFMMDAIFRGWKNLWFKNSVSLFCRYVTLCGGLGNFAPMHCNDPMILRSNV